ncbi:MAG: alpha-L-rhamnosidase N-terminal domain-containing protein [Anaerolineae bacterium]|nr:alpha-L-rhamnosidase N-terminal domain-containing protein [Anaerolineae bacterium]
MTNEITSKDFSDIRWRGNWIWTDAPAMPGDRFAAERGALKPQGQAHGLFRKTFTLKSVPKRVPTRITADSRYLLFVNGQEVNRGPVRSQPRRLHYDLLDLSPYLKSGENVIAVLVKYYGAARSYWMPAMPTMTLGRGGVLVFEANLGEAIDAPDGWMVSDDSWKALKSDAWTEPPSGRGPIGGGIPVEILDAGQLPFGWEQPGFDDTTWSNAALIPALQRGASTRSQPPSEPYGPMYPRTIALLGGEMLAPKNIQIEYLTGPIDLAGTIALSAEGPAQRVDASLAASATRSEQAVTFPVHLDVPAGGAVRLVADMGRIVSGFVQLEAESPAGTVFEFSYVEDPLTVSPEGPFGRHAGARYIARGAADATHPTDCYKAFDSNGLRYVCLLVHSTDGAVTLKGLSVQEYVYPWTEGAAFACSDEELNRIFQAGIRTVQLNSHDAFLDCPTREQRAWVGDAVVHQMVHLVTNLDWRLAWRYLSLSDSPRSDGILPMSVGGDVEWRNGTTIPDWSLHWVHGVYNLYRFLGDKETVIAYMPSVARVLRWFASYQNAQGLLEDLIEWTLIDWAAVSNSGVSSIYTAMWARGLREFAEMAAWLEEKTSQRWAEDLYEKAQAGFEVFWDEKRGSYVDHIVDGVQEPEMSQLGGATAIVSGLAPRERWGRIIDTITDPDKLVVRTWRMVAAAQGRPPFGLTDTLAPDWNTQTQIVKAEPFMSYVVHDAVAKAGKADRLPSLYRAWSQFLVDGYDTIGEDWAHGTHVHGWSCTPTKDMVFYTLGVTPAEPGYAVVRVAPRLGGLAWAKGQVPTPHGLIAVHVTQEGVTVDSPVSVILDLTGQPLQTLPAGHHEIKKV